MKRRIVLRWGLSLLAALPFHRVRLFAQVRSLADSDIKTLESLAASALPSELGPDGVKAVVDKFMRWLESYRAGVQMSPGYGVPRPRLTPELDVSSYRPQLAALREAMREQGEMKDSAPARHRMIEASLQDAGIESLPSSPNGRHVIADLLSFYLGSSEARDLCYQAEIGRYTCPGLDRLVEKPKPLTQG